MTFSIRILATAAVLAAPTAAFADSQADPERVAFLKCALAGHCAEEALAEANREESTIETSDRDIISSADLRAARPASPSSRNVAPSRTQVRGGTRPTTRPSRSTRPSRPAPSRPRRDTSAVIVSPEMKGDARLMVTFGTGKSALTAASKKEIDSLIQANNDLKASGTTLRLRIEGHASRTGKEDRNVELSNERAEAVRAALIEGGFSPEQLEAKGFGSSQPIEDVEGIKPSHRANQRVIAVPLN